MFKGNMSTVPIPARVYALCKIVENYNGIKRGDLLKLMEPPGLKKQEDKKEKTSYFSETMTCAQELKLVDVKDNKVSLLVFPEDLQSIDDMRLLAIKRLNEFKEYQFYKVTKAALQMNEKLFELGAMSGNKSVDYFTAATKTTVTNVHMNGWRFWVDFLGFGYVPDAGTFIPNSYRFLKSILSISDLKDNTEYSFSDFLGKVNIYGSILTEANQDANVINMAFSNALRILETNKEIELLSYNDRSDNYKLYPSETFYNQPVNAVMIRGAEK